MIKQLFFSITLSMLLAMSHQVSGQNESFTSGDAKEALSFAAEQYSLMMEQLPYGRVPRSTHQNGTLRTSDLGSWTSGFYPGSCWYLYEYTLQDKFKAEAIQRTMSLENQKFNKRTHDVGFIIYNSFGNGYRLTGEKNFKEISLEGANSLISRYDPEVGCILSWSWSNKWSYPVIIDNMMNLELLYWASKVTDNEKYKNIASNHADKTLNNHFRDDNSSYHVVSYDKNTGEANMKDTHQGYSSESAWARGQSWGLYGFTMSYRMTRNRKYLEQAKKIADFILSHPNLPEDKIPYWDFDAPDIPNVERDASAGAIMASALVELSRYVNGEQKERYLNNAQIMLKSLSSKKYRADKGENGNFILKHCAGNIPGNSEVDVPLVYADYYYIEALMRYLKLSSV